MCSSRNIYTTPTEGIGNSLRVGGSQRPKHLSKCMKLDWNFQRGGGGGLRKNPFHGGGMDIFGNHTILLFPTSFFMPQQAQTHCVKETLSDCDKCSIFWTRKVWSVNLKTTTASDAPSLAFEGNTDSSNSSFSFFWIRRKHCIHRSWNDCLGTDLVPFGTLVDMTSIPDGSLEGWVLQWNHINFFRPQFFKHWMMLSSE